MTNSNKLLVAKDGKDAKLSTNPDDFKFHSDYNTLKYYLSGHYTMSNVTDTTTVSIAHNLGYVPFFIAYCNDWVSQPTYYGLTEFFRSPGGRLSAARVYADATNLYLSLNLDHGAAITVEWYYKIFRNNLNL